MATMPWPDLADCNIDRQFGQDYAERRQCLLTARVNDPLALQRLQSFVQGANFGPLNERKVPHIDLNGATASLVPAFFLTAQVHVEYLDDQTVQRDPLYLGQCEIFHL
jgi:hypothetical protein